MIQQIKSLIRDQLGVPSFAVLMLLGALAYLALNALLRKPLTSPWGILAPLAIGVALESYEIWVQYKDVGLLAAGNDPVAAILLRHALDVGFLLIVPLVLVAAGALAVR